MSEYEKECKEKITEAINESYVCGATTDSLTVILDEVYAKAEAFEAIAAIITELKGVHETDESGDYYEDFGHKAKQIVLDYESGDRL